jgi:dipeptide/tripeptide permease
MPQVVEAMFVLQMQPVHQTLAMVEVDRHQVVAVPTRLGLQVVVVLLSFAMPTHTQRQQPQQVVQQSPQQVVTEYTNGPQWATDQLHFN